MRREIKAVTRVICTPDGQTHGCGSAVRSDREYETILCGPDGGAQAQDIEADGRRLFCQRDYSFEKRDIAKYVIEGGRARLVTKKTIDGERTFVENAASVKTGEAYTAVLHLEIGEDEAIYGLGQHERGTYNYRNVKEYLYQNNMQIPMPVFLSSQGYGVFFDADCLMVYEERDNLITLTFDAVDQIAYYIIPGKSFDEIIGQIRELTGSAVMLPRWAYGYVQSRERYVTQKQMLDTLEEFERRQIPVSCLVLDWNSWESGKWGNKHVDKERFPDLPGMVKAMHEKDCAFMISIWPNMNKGGENNAEMMEAGTLLANLSTYDAFSEKARDLYWTQLKRELVAAGTDAWWCDSTEPFTPDWNGPVKREEEERYELARENLTRYFDARVANTYALAHARGLYEHQRAECADKRMVNLTRSGSPSIQNYGVILWSGDIMATWEVFRNQIAEGLSMGMSGIPYWTLDIGAFFVGNTEGFRRFANVTEGEAPWFWHGLFEKGAEDSGYRELYTRWLQMGTFLPVMRSHGTDTPREPWHFGEPGTIYYDTITAYIRRRYRMLPYSYSLAHRVETEGYTIMRSLMFDFAEDSGVREIGNQFMYGPAYLVCPVTEAFGYGPENEKLDREERWKVYLPGGSLWYQENTGKCLEGGQEITVEAPVSWQPLFIRAGSVIPLDGREGKTGVPDTVEVYEGADGSFVCYTDEGNGYGYQEGMYAAFALSYEESLQDGKKRLKIGAVQGSYPLASVEAPLPLHIRYYRMDGTCREQSLSYDGSATEILLA